MAGRILITGATGFVGAAVARLLAKSDFDLRLVIRNNSRLDNIAGLKAETIEADLTDPMSLNRAVQGCRYVFHVAADYRLWVPDPKAMYLTNVLGTKILMLAALKAGVERIVYCSSVAALGLKGDGTIADEMTPINPATIIGVYKQSKYTAEQEVIKLVHSHGLPAIIVNPSTPIGPGDIKPTPTGKMIRDCANGQMPAFVDTGLNIVHVDDVAIGHVMALKKGRIGEKYILGGDNMSLVDFFAMTSEVAGTKPPRIQLSQNILLPVAWISEIAARLFSFEPRVTREMLAMSRKKMFFSSDKAKSELGYDPRPARHAVYDAVNWFRNHGLVK